MEKGIMLCSDKTARCLNDLVPHAEINFQAEVGHSNVNDVNKIIAWLSMNS